MGNTCKCCGAVFVKRLSTDRFCSSKCAYAYKKPIKQGTIRKSISKSNRTFHAVKLEMAEKMMDNPHCQHCGIPTQNLDLHHIFYRSEVPNHAFLNDPVNLIWVCRECHEWFHESKDNRRRIAEERGLYDIFNKSTRYSKNI